MSKREKNNLLAQLICKYRANEVGRLPSHIEARVILVSTFPRQPICVHKTRPENGCSRTAGAGDTAMFNGR